jgi:hypothetical protein
VHFEWTYVISIFEANDTLYLKCSCCGYEQNGYLCECISAVVNEAPKPADVVICWQKPYYVLHLTGNQDLDKAFDKLVENETPGLMLPANSVEAFHADLAVAECMTGQKRKYFELTLPPKTPAKLHPGVI